MVPNIDLIVIALLHGSLVVFLVTLVTCLVFLCLLVAFAMALLVVVFVELYDISSFISGYLVAVKPHVELGFMLALLVLMRSMVVAAIASSTFVEGVVINVRVKMEMLKQKVGVKM